MEGDKDKKLALIEVIRDDNRRLEGEINALRTRQQENDGEIEMVRAELDGVLRSRIECEAAKTRTERTA